MDHSGAVDGEPSTGTQSSARRSIEGPEEAETTLEGADSGDQTVALSSLAASRLLERRGWSNFKRIKVDRMDLIFSKDGREVMPVTKAHLAAFIRWVAEEREVGRRRIDASSIPKYI